MDKCTRMNVRYENGPARIKFMSLSPILDLVSEIFCVLILLQLCGRN